MAIVPFQDNSNKALAVKEPSFCKVMVGSPILQRLRLPLDFMKHLEDEVGNEAMLSGPNGDFWKVVLQRNKEDGFMYLRGGWQDFVTYHGLGKGEFLLFIYGGNLRFKVKIFDPSGLERIGNSQDQGQSSSGKRKRGRPRKIN